MTIDFLDPEAVILRSLLERNAAEIPDETFVLFEDGTSWTWAKALRQAYLAANELRGMGVKQGDVVAVALPNGAGYLQAWWGAATLGAAIVPINTAYRGALISRLVEIAKPKIIVTIPEFRKRLEEVNVHLTVPILDPSELKGANASPPPLEHPIHPWDPICLAMTSGTTGPSKLVRVSYAHCMRGGMSAFDLWGRTKSDVLLCDVPSVHMGGVYMVHSSIAHQNRVVVRGRPALDAYWEVARDAGVTFSQIFGTMVTYLDAQPLRGAEKSHNLRLVLALPLPANPAQFQKKFNIGHLFIAWGSTEVPVPIASWPNFDLPPGSTGRVLPGWDVRLVDKNDIQVPPGTAGEAIVRSDIPWLISTEYVDNPIETTAAWRNGWFHTGDMLRRDDEGNFFFVDRLKDALRRRGQNIPSYEVESVVLAFPGIIDAAVVPERSDVESEDEIKVWIVPAKSVDINFRDLLYFCVERLPHFMVPRYFEVSSELPKTPSARVQKHQLRERGNSIATWDRVANGLEVTRHGIEQLKPRSSALSNTRDKTL